MSQVLEQIKDRRSICKYKPDAVLYVLPHSSLPARMG